jgi:uncharacterized protein (DUF885 family)
VDDLQWLQLFTCTHISGRLDNLLCSALIKRPYIYRQINRKSAAIIPTGSFFQPASLDNHKNAIEMSNLLPHQVEQLPGKWSKRLSIPILHFRRRRYELRTQADE